MLAITFLFFNSIIFSRADIKLEMSTKPQMEGRKKMEGFVVGGDTAKIEEFPHSAFIIIDCHMDNGEANWICGSSLINQRILLTAAHCIYHCNKDSKVVASIGHANRNKGMQFTASGMTTHEKYNQFTNDCDIALIKLKKAVPYSDKIKRVILMKEPPYNEPATLAGWGLISETTRQTAIILKKVDQSLWTREACSRTLGNRVPKGTVCASSKNKEYFPAQGDSGSALVVRGYIQVGVVSFKTPILAANLIVYTDVGYYYDWIVYTMEKLYCH